MHRIAMITAQAGALTLAVLLAGCGSTAPKGGGLRIEEGRYPRVFFFRSSESPGKEPALTYEEWDKSFSRLMGIQGKVLDEELPGLSKRNIEFFARFKQLHPEQMALLHFNGNARDPLFQLQDYAAGHWLYFSGAKILSAVAAEEGETEIKVSDARLFKVGVGRYKIAREDIGLCSLDAGGKPDWNQSEQVRLVSADPAKNTIRVKRALFGTKARAFAAGKAYAAAHIHEGPWGDGANNLMWFYNHSTACPKDANGKTASDVLAEELVRRFQPGGELAAFDGLEFDVLHFQNIYHPDLRDNALRGMDADADGKADAGILGGVNTYGIGVTEFCRRLREKFPQSKLLMADGMGLGNQRAFHILNGIESEGFPHLRDHTMRDWSGGLNRHFFWARNARPPVFNYVNHKYRETDPQTGLPRTPQIPFGIHRLAFAAAVFTDAAICYSYAPQNEPGERLGIWDEFRKGTENELGWLGKPVAEAVHLATRTPDLLAGKGKQPAAAMFRGTRVAFAADGNALKIASGDPKAAETRFVLAGVPTQGPDLFVTFDVRGAGMRGYPPETARMLRVEIAGAPADRFMTWVNQEDFPAGFYFSNVKPGPLDLEFAIEGAEPLWLANLTIHAGADAMVREFEHGVVLGNPSPRPYAFPLDTLFPGKAYRRLKASSQQDTAANNGAKVSGGNLELPAKDALFLVRQ